MVVPISRFMIRLLVGDRVADLCRPGAGELAYRGCLVDLGDRDGAHGIDHAADDPAACGILDVAHLAIDGQGVAHLEAVLGANIDDEGAVGGNVGHHAVDLHNLDGGGRQRRRLLIQTESHIGGRLGDSRAQNGVPEVGTPHIEAAPTRIAPASTRSHNAGAAARLLAVALHAGQDLGGGRVDHARRNGAHSGGLGGLDAAYSEAVERAGRRSAADRGTLIVAAELGDAADDDGIHTQNAGDLGGARRVGAVAVGEILLLDDLVELFALDDGVNAVVDQFVHNEVGNTLADILIGTEERSHAGPYGAIIEVHYRDALPLLGRCRGNQRQAYRKTRNSAHRTPRSQT